MLKPKVENIEIDKLVPCPFDIRSDVGDVTELLESIKEIGVKDSITVCPSATKGKFDILDGNRRHRVAYRLGLKTLPALVLPPMIEAEKLKFAILTNIVRRTLTPRDQCKAIIKYKELNPNKTAEVIATEFGLPARTIRGYIYLKNLDPSIKIAPPGKSYARAQDRNEIPLKMAMEIGRVTQTRHPKDKNSRVIAQRELANKTTVLPCFIRRKVIEKYASSPEKLDKIIRDTQRNMKYSTSVFLNSEMHNALKRFMEDRAKRKSDALRVLILKGLEHFGYMAA